MRLCRARVISTDADVTGFLPRRGVMRATSIRNGDDYGTIGDAYRTYATKEPKLTQIAGQDRTQAPGRHRRPTGSGSSARVSRRTCRTSTRRETSSGWVLRRSCCPFGSARARYLMLRMLERAGEQRVAIPA